jgi:hypothetical protein
MSNQLVGQKFNHFIVLRKIGVTKDGHSKWLCRCECGVEKTLNGSNLKNTKSCGCQRYKHQKTNTPIYHVWAAMKQRCTNPNDKSYPIYGGRGITLCDDWQQFQNFFKDMGEKPTNKHQIERIDNNKGYCKTNCRWATPKEQGINKRNNHMINFHGQNKCVAEWSRETGIHEQTLWKRIKLGWSDEETLTIPPRKNKENK